MSQTLAPPVHSPPPPATAPTAPTAPRTAIVPGQSWIADLHSWWRRHPDLAPLLVILAVGLVLRLALLYRVPPLFMPGDSQSFLTPAYDLARGLGFDPILKRPLGYPLLVAGAIWLLGEDLRGLVFVQALLGLVTVTAAYWLGRLTFGRAAGVLAALSVAVGGQLLIYEHYILAESVFATLLALALLALVGSARRPGGTARLAVLGGLGLAAASLFRPIAEVVLPLVPLFYLVLLRTPRRALLLTAWAGVGFAGLMLPALGADLALRGGVSSGALGEHLLWRITRSDSGYLSRADVPPADSGEPGAAARRYVIRKAVDRTLPQEIFTGLRAEYGLSSAEADALMRAVALEAIGRQPERYLTSTVRMAWELFLGEDQSLGETSKRDGEARYINPQGRQRTWFEDRVLHLGEPPAPAVENEFQNAQWLTSIYQPGRLIWVIVAGWLVGAGAAILVPRYRPALLLALTIPPLLLANAALAGPEARFRYPLDPLIAVVAAGGLVWLALTVRTLVGGRARR